MQTPRYKHPAYRQAGKQNSILKTQTFKPLSLYFWILNLEFYLVIVSCILVIAKQCLVILKLPLLLKF